jgi:hypothetical protein
MHIAQVKIYPMRENVQNALPFLYDAFTLATVEVKSCLTLCWSYWLGILKCQRGSREYLTGHFITIGSATRAEINLRILCPKMH